MPARRPLPAAAACTMPIMSTINMSCHMTARAGFNMYATRILAVTQRDAATEDNTAAQGGFSSGQEQEGGQERLHTLPSWRVRTPACSTTSSSTERSAYSKLRSLQAPSWWSQVVGRHGLGTSLWSSAVLRLSDAAHGCPKSPPCIS